MGFMSSIGNSLGGIAGAVGGVASTILGNNSAKHEAEKNREWQEEMSNTAISRRMQDLRNAGLNPLLAVDNASAGASTPAGSQAQLTKVDPTWITALSNAKLQRQQGEVAKAEERKVNAEAKAQEQDNSLFTMRAEQMELQAELQRQGILTQKTMQDLNNANSLEAKARILVHQAQKNNINMNTEEAKRKVQLLDVDLESWKNSPEGRNHYDFVNSISNPYNLGATVVDGAYRINHKVNQYLYNSAKSLWYNINHLPKVERRIKYHGYK